MNQTQIKQIVENNVNSVFGYSKVEDYKSLFKINGEIIDVGKSFGIIYSVDEDSKTLHKHGSFDTIQKLFNNKYEKISLFDFVLLEVPLEDYAWINTIINISSSSWIDRLIDHLNIIDVEVI